MTLFVIALRTAARFDEELVLTSTCHGVTKDTRTSEKRICVRQRAR